MMMMTTTKTIIINYAFCPKTLQSMDEVQSQRKIFLRGNLLKSHRPTLSIFRPHPPDLVKDTSFGRRLLYVYTIS